MLKGLGIALEKKLENIYLTQFVTFILRCGMSPTHDILYSVLGQSLPLNIAVEINTHKNQSQKKKSTCIYQML